MKILVVGGGGREHALAWKLAQSPRVAEVLVGPGNAGTAREPKCRNAAIAAMDIAALVDLARERVGLTVIGPEGPLVAGIVDAFEAAGLPVSVAQARGATRAASSSPRNSWCDTAFPRRAMRRSRRRLLTRRSSGNSAPDRRESRRPRGGQGRHHRRRR
jgi:hypothetical protein